MNKYLCATQNKGASTLSASVQLTVELTLGSSGESKLLHINVKVRSMSPQHLQAVLRIIDVIVCGPL